MFLKPKVQSLKSKPSLYEINVKRYVTRLKSSANEKRNKKRYMYIRKIK
jgi:hypothetical protein